MVKESISNMSNCGAYYDLRLLYKSDQLERFDRFPVVVQKQLCSRDARIPRKQVNSLAF
jgi:hypothetical protein